VVFVTRCGSCGQFFHLPELSCGCQLCRERSICEGCSAPLSTADIAHALCGACPLCPQGAGLESNPEEHPYELEGYLRSLGLVPDVWLCPMTALVEEVDPGNRRLGGGVLQFLYAMPEAAPEVIDDLPREWAEYPFQSEEERQRLLDELRELLRQGWITPTGTPTAALVPPGPPLFGEGREPLPIPGLAARRSGVMPSGARPSFIARYRAWFRGKPGVYEGRWDPKGKQWRVLVEDGFDRDLVRDVMVLAELVRRRRRPGPPVGSGALSNMTPDDYRATYVKLWQEHRRDRLPPPTVYDMADELGVHLVTSWRYRRDHGIPWPPIPDPELLQHH
jgi:hypothetical protein